MNINGRLYDVFLYDTYVGSLFGTDEQDAILAARRAYKKRKGKSGRWRASDSKLGIITFPEQEKKSPAQGGA